MPRTIEVQLFKFDELSDKAKERARDWFRDPESYPPDDWWDAVYEDFQRICTTLGIDIKQLIRNVGGDPKRTQTDPAIYFRGFWSQGDGASFEGCYSYKKGASKAIRDYAPQDAELHRIADGLTRIQRRYFYSLVAKICLHGGGGYVHKYMMNFDISTERGELSAGDEEAFSELMRDLADWLYHTLEKEHEYLTSDECVDESILVNEYEFTEEGNTP